MIKTDTEYKATLEKIREFKKHIEASKKELASQGWSEAEIERGIGPSKIMCEEMEWELNLYKRCQKGDFRGIEHDFGKMLIAYRIYRGWSQSELARRLQVSRNQVSRDEANEYHGVTFAKLQRIMRVLGLQMHLFLNPEGPKYLQSKNETSQLFVAHNQIAKDHATS